MKLQQTKERPRFIGIYEAARYCNVSYRAIKSAMDTGRLPYAKFGPQTYRISVEELDRFMKGSQKKEQ